MSPIIDTPFIDLYLGPDFTDVKGLDGQSGRVEAPENWKESAQLLREECSRHFEVHQDPEFSLIKDGTVLRVTQIHGRLRKIWARRVASSRSTTPALFKEYEAAGNWR
ncbi:Type II secretion system protein E [Pseudomonas savastanoi pv. phaseolicola]|nr:Type II secretion system protein E [Pseudomonas savastanoi pv. phaseolicola]KPB69489.1 Type II secretion system protein E [Pseudomonas amygdali pv. mellea]